MPERKCQHIFCVSLTDQSQITPFYEELLAWVNYFTQDKALEQDEVSETPFTVDDITSSRHE